MTKRMTSRQFAAVRNAKRLRALELESNDNERAASQILRLVGDATDVAPSASSDGAPHSSAERS